MATRIRSGPLASERATRARQYGALGRWAPWGRPGCLEACAEKILASSPGAVLLSADYLKSKLLRLPRGNPRFRTRPSKTRLFFRPFPERPRIPPAADLLEQSRLFAFLGSRRGDGNRPFQKRSARGPPKNTSRGGPREKSGKACFFGAEIRCF